MQTLPKPTSGLLHTPGLGEETDRRVELWTGSRGRQGGYKTPGMQKECHKVAWRGRGTKPWTTEAPSSHSERAAARATRTRGQPEENIRPRRYVPNATAWPAEMQREDAIRLP